MYSPPPFQDRLDAGAQLAAALTHLHLRPQAGVVLALPRGGVPVAFPVAQALKLPLEVFVVRKLGLPSQPELAMGALAEGGVRLFNEDVLAHSGVSAAEIERVSGEEAQELDRRIRTYRGERPAPEVRGRTVILIDDGAATGANLRAAITALRAQEPARLVVGVPVGSAEAGQLLSQLADEVVCLHRPEMFYGVGQAYQNFDQTSDAEVLHLLKQAAPAPHQDGEP
ncbi:phosphoribosyl transferase [Deinococcus irradiatisoli]|uniref:Phosphoribosyl transferase n=1 Tax=Deinococcus irradiatisoli TaxID=2202254 RepID=A0A2Z3JK60_9DEIO|nr:phosphoribosyltransferase [Deinococcus irradiatisoli]AWN22308.1 phosphoribosyl transferase [Deinococcus irradiatisoli]